MDLNVNNKFKVIINSLFIRNKIFQNIKQIHDQLYKSNGYVEYRCDWRDLGCFPHLLIKHNYIDRFKLIYNTLIKDNCNNNNLKNTNNVILKWKHLYLLSFRYAVEVGNVEALEFLQESLATELDCNKLLFGLNTISHLKSIEFLHRYAGAWMSNRSRGIMNAAAANGDLDIVMFLHNNRTEGCSKDAMDSAASNGHLDIVKFLHSNRTEGCSIQAMEKAAKKGHLDVVKFLRENRTEGYNHYIIDLTAKFGHLDVVAYLLASTTASCCSIDSAALSCSLDLVRYLHENRPDAICSTKAIEECGNLEVIKFLHANRSEGCTKRAMHNAAVSGHLDIVKFLNENRTEGCHEDTVIEAGYGGYFEVFKYLLENRIGNPDVEDALELEEESDGIISYFEFRDVSDLQWLKNKAPHMLTSLVYNRACNLTVFKWIHKNLKLPFPDSAMDNVDSLRTKADKIQIIQYLHENGAVATTNAMDNALHVEIVSFLHNNRTEGCTYKAMYKAIQNENLAIVKFLEQNRTEHLYQENKFEKLYNHITYDYKSRVKLIKQNNL